MRNNLGMFLAVGSLVTGGVFVGGGAAQAALINNSQLQLNTNAVFFDADPTAAATSLAVMFLKDGANLLPGGAVDYAPNNTYGNFDISSVSTGSFLPYISDTNPSGLEILSLTLPSKTPTIQGTNRVFVDPSNPLTWVDGSTINPSTKFPGGKPFLLLTNIADTATPIKFFVDTITEFTDNFLVANTTKQFNIGAKGHFEDADGFAIGDATINGTFSAANNPNSILLVDIGTGQVCTTPNVGNCKVQTKSTFGGTFNLVVEDVDVPESSPVSALIGFGLVGSAFALKRKARLN